MKMKLLPLLIFMVGCEDRIITVTEYIDRPVYCESDVPIKKYAADGLKASDPVAEKTRALLIERLERENTERELRAELKGCEKPENSPTLGDTQ